MYANPDEGTSRKVLVEEIDWRLEGQVTDSTLVDALPSPLPFSLPIKTTTTTTTVVRQPLPCDGEADVGAKGLHKLICVGNSLKLTIQNAYVMN